MSSDSLILQSLAMCNNYHYTGQYSKALNVLSQILRIYPDNVIANQMMSATIKLAMDDEPLIVLKDICVDNGLSHIFGKNWRGESLNNCSITIFCDENVGDILNMLRYVKQIKETWNCKIYLNCYAHYSVMRRLMEKVDFVDFFVKEHVQTDFHTNIFSLGTLLNGYDFVFHYPAHYEELLHTDIPNCEIDFRLEPKKVESRVGLAWESKNSQKSLSLEGFRDLNIRLCSLSYNHVDCDFLEQHDFLDLLDIAALIASLDFIITADNDVLYLAAIMGKQTHAVLLEPFDLKWSIHYFGQTAWYPSVLIHSKKWQKSIKEFVVRKYSNA